MSMAMEWPNQGLVVEFKSMWAQLAAGKCGLEPTPNIEAAAEILAEHTQ